MKRAIIAVDGASKGNPGPAGIGVVISDESGPRRRILREIGEYIGQATNNFAEYTALIRGLSEALQMGFSHAVVQTDSELVARQLSGQYRVKHEALLPLYDSVLDLMGRFKAISVKHVTRDRNKEADKLASNAAASGGEKAQPSLALENLSSAASAKEEATKPAPSPRKTAMSREIAMTKRISVRTSSRSQFVDITDQVQDAVKESGVSDGVCTVYVLHTTAGITINENADPDVTRDIIDTLERLIPRDGRYRHVEGNADSHVKASLMGFSASVLVEKRCLVLGTWQGIYFCEFDGPRNRQVLVRVG